MTPFIACKHYDEKIATIHTSKIYYDVISSEQESNQQHEQQQAHKDKRVLVMDDEYDVSFTIKLVLERNDFKVDSFIDASEALENFTTGLYDLVILDIKMPVMSGFSLYGEIKKLDDKVIICFLTAADEAYYETLKECYPNINQNHIIRKPVDNDSLIKRIKSIL
ncbi:MAG: response regulator [Candidatus Nitrosopolaris sp.]